MDTAIVLGVILGIGAAVLYFVFEDARKRHLADAKQNYDESLQQLKDYPLDSDLRETTLRLGREYSALSRDDGAVTIFDEVALANDIQAVCAGAVAVAATKTVGIKTSYSSVEERLIQLEELLAKELISADEFQAKRELVISEL